MSFEGKSGKYLEDVVLQFTGFPGIGRKTALRFALHLLRRSDTEVELFLEAVRKLKTQTKFCRICHNLSDDDICPICSDSKRNRSIICVVEGIHDVIAIESTSQYNGLYHVLGGLISPIDGIGPNDIKIKSLIERLQNSKVDEVIFALPATTEGDTTNYYIGKKISGLCNEITVISRGVAVGEELQYTDGITLGQSIINRKPFFELLKK